MSGGLDARVGVLTGHGLGRRALSLGGANAIDYTLQFLLPVVLVRCLDAEAFGQYRLLWLAVGTVMAVVTKTLSPQTMGEDHATPGIATRAVVTSVSPTPLPLTISTMPPKATAPIVAPRKAPTMPCQKRSGRKTVKCQSAMPIVK